MKVHNRRPISAFGGINFVYDFLDKGGFATDYRAHLPELGPQSRYGWGDIIHSLLSIYLCGGDHIEDLQCHLRGHLSDNPYLRLPSPDTVLRRVRALAGREQRCRTGRGSAEHTYSTNPRLGRLNIALLNRLGALDGEQGVLDYDNSILFNEKSDSRMTYKRGHGYQPGVCTLDERYILYVENRNGNSDARSFQGDTLGRMFSLLGESGVEYGNYRFRADAASYQYATIKLLEREVAHFYIGCPNRYVEKYFSQVGQWHGMGQQGMQVGELKVRPFQQQARKEGAEAREYRLVVKRRPKKDGQADLFTGDCYEYRAILTNDWQGTPERAASFYNRRGNMERQFDILKNDFGWNNMPFSKMGQNLAFLYLTAICRNLYNNIMAHFSERYPDLRPTYRVKKFLFRFIAVPSKWIYRARQHHLVLYGKRQYET